MIHIFTQYIQKLKLLKKRLFYKIYHCRNDFHEVVAGDIKKIHHFYNPSRESNSNEKTVIIASYLPLPYVLKMEGLFSQLLKEKKYNVICINNKINSINFIYHKQAFGNKCYLIDDYIPWKKYQSIKKTINSILNQNLEEIKNFVYHKIPVGRHIFARISGLDQSGKIDLNKKIYKILKSKLIRSCLEVEAYEIFLAQINPQLIISIEKGMPGNCEIFYHAINKKIDFIQWLSCHEPQSIMLKRYNQSNVNNHPFSISQKSWQLIKASNNSDYKEKVMKEFEDGYTHNKWFEYKKLTNNTKFYKREEFIKKYNLDPDKKIVVIFAHILNDANLFYGDDLFKNGFREWLVKTVRAAGENKQVNWILKLHPANIYRRKNSGYTGEYGELIALKDDLGTIPDFLKLIVPDDDISPLSVFKLLDYSITVRGTVGAEIPCFGKVVLTAGTGRYSGLGFTNDSTSISEYLNKIKNIHKIPPISTEIMNRAIKHAYLFFNVRPAKYDTFAIDAFKEEQGPYSRDVKFIETHYKKIMNNPQLSQIIEWMISSKDEDFLNFNFRRSI